MTPQESPADREAFELTGTIQTWQATTRTLTVEGQELVLAAHLLTIGLAPGLRVVGTGYRSPKTGRLIVTALRLT